MKKWIIVPVKPLALGKSRLSGLLEDEERIQLNTLLVKNTLKLLAEGVPEGNILVVSKDPAVLGLAKDAGVKTYLENGMGGLNKALYQVNNQVMASMDLALIIPIDLPLMTSNDIQKLLAYGERPPVVVVVPDRHDKGTNALLVSPVGSIPYRFGENSCKKHVREAEKRGIPVIVRSVPSLAIDLDVEDDLEALKNYGYVMPVTARTPEKEILI